MIFKTILARLSLFSGCLIVLVFLSVALFAPWIAPPKDPSTPQYIPRYGYGPEPEPPTPEHPLGLLSEKYDTFYGLIWGTRAAMGMGLTVALGRALLGIIIGLLAGTYGGLVDALLMRLADAFMAFPMIAATVVMLALFGTVYERWPQGWFVFQPSQQELIIILALVMFGWVPSARLIRGNVLVEREKTYIQAARSMGIPTWRLIFRHLFPNSTYGLFALLSSDIGAVVVLITAFTFTGVVPWRVMQADWGIMLYSARDWIVGPPSGAFRYWYTYLPASAAIVFFSTGWSLVGDGLRDALDPRLRGNGAALAPRKKHQEHLIKKEPVPAVFALSLAHSPIQADILPVQISHRSAVPLDDEESFAWLEYLAERQGATEALLLEPEKRRQTPPEWVLTKGAYTPMTSSSPLLDQAQAILAKARLAIDHGEISQALPIYRNLIRSCHHLEEVIQDLHQAHKLYPANVEILETLGDAYLRLDDFQHAMDAYAKAEKMLLSK